MPGQCALRNSKAKYVVSDCSIDERVFAACVILMQYFYPTSFQYRWSSKSTRWVAAEHSENDTILTIIPGVVVSCGPALDSPFYHGAICALTWLGMAFPFAELGRN